ncbi:MAG: serine/threonine phosphatase [Cyanobacteria bacterium P01_E01_bin.6]
MPESRHSGPDDESSEPAENAEAVEIQAIEAPSNTDESVRQHQTDDTDDISTEIQPPIALRPEYPAWLAILTLNVSPESIPPETTEIDLVAVTDALQQQAIALQNKGYLDAGLRYRVRECLLKTPEIHQGNPTPYLEISAFDDKPSQPSHLDQLFSQQHSADALHQLIEQKAQGLEESPLGQSSTLDTENSATGILPGFHDAEEPKSTHDTSARGESEQAHDSESSIALEANLSAANLSAEDPVKLETAKLETAKSNVDDALTSQIPDIAAVYLAVQDQFYPSLPQIHDAWIADDVSVIIVENRNPLQGLDEAIKLPETKALQVLHWFHEMTELWAVLQPQHYHQSLLDTTNLHVDEDHILCITCLYDSAHKTELPLSAMGQLWQQLLMDSPLQSNDYLSQLCRALAQSQIGSIDELRFQLEDIAMQLHDESLELSRMDGADSIIATLKTGELPQVSNPTVVDGSSEIVHDSSFMDSFPGDDASDDEFEGLAEGDETPTVVLPMRLFHLADVGVTDIGRQRDHNEDYFSIKSETQKQDTPAGRKFSARGLYVLCDGMGGHAAGEVASALAVSTLEEYFADQWVDQFPSKDEILAGVQKANKSIYDLNQANACYGSGRMGTTLVMMLVDDIKVAIAHVGDSRVYRFCRRTGLEQITIDHEVGQREIQRGVEPVIAYARPDAYQLTQALGPRDSAYINPGIQTLEVNEDTLFILCSDGLSDNNLLERFCDSNVEPMLSSQSNLPQELGNLLDLANQHNGHDNITAIAVRLKVRPKIQGLQ